MQSSQFIAKVLPLELFSQPVAGGGGASEPEPHYTPNVGSEGMEPDVSADPDARLDRLAAEVLAARRDVLRIQAALRDHVAALQRRPQAG